MFFLKIQMKAIGPGVGEHVTCIFESSLVNQQSDPMSDKHITADDYYQIISFVSESASFVLYLFFLIKLKASYL